MQGWHTFSEFMHLFAHEHGPCGAGGGGVGVGAGASQALQSPFLIQSACAGPHTHRSSPGKGLLLHGWHCFSELMHFVAHGHASVASRTSDVGAVLIFMHSILSPLDDTAWTVIAAFARELGSALDSKISSGTLLAPDASGQPIPSHLMEPVPNGSLNVFAVQISPVQCSLIMPACMSMVKVPPVIASSSEPAPTVCVVSPSVRLVGVKPVTFPCVDESPQSDHDMERVPPASAVVVSATSVPQALHSPFLIQSA